MLLAAVYVLAMTLGVLVVGLLSVTAVGALDDGVTALQSSGRWWVLAIVAFAISLVYTLLRDRIRQHRDRAAKVKALEFYLEAQCALRSVPAGTESLVRDELPRIVDNATYIDPKTRECVQFPAHVLYAGVDTLIDETAALMEKYGVGNASGRSN